MSEEEVYYDSWKEDRDFILEYNQVTLDDVTVSNVLGIGVDNLSSKQAVVKVMDMIDNGGVHHIILLNPYKIHRIKSNVDLKVISSRASMKIASGAGVKWAARILGSPLKERLPALSFIMDIIRISEIKEYTLFIVGGKPEIAERAFFNIKKSFPKIRIVGRHGGYFSHEREKSVIEAIKKSEPNIVFVGLGFPKEDKWIYKIKSEFKNAVFVSVGGSIDIISGEIKKAPPFFMKRGLDWLYRIITRPWRLGRLLRLLIFYLHVIVRSIIS